MDDLTIRPVKPVPIKDTDIYHPHLPSIKRNSGSLILLVGTTNSGKTTLINNLLLNSNFWGRRKGSVMGAFENVYLFSPSLYLDDSTRFLVENFDCKTDYNEIDKTINGIREAQLSLPKEKRPRLMMVLDDGVGLIERNSNVNFLATRYRHFNLNMIMSVQSFRACSPVMRVNANYVILMNGIVNMKELEKIGEEYNDIFKGTLLYCYKKYAPKKYDFISMKLRENPPKMYRGFSEEINWKKHRVDAKNFKFDDISDDETEEESDGE